MRLFEIQYSTPGRLDGEWRQNGRCYCYAPSAECAIQLLTDDEPDAEVHQVVMRSNEYVKFHWAAEE